MYNNRELSPAEIQNRNRIRLRKAFVIVFITFSLFNGVRMLFFKTPSVSTTEEAISAAPSPTPTSIPGWDPFKAKFVDVSPTPEETPNLKEVTDQKVKTSPIPSVVPTPKPSATPAPSPTQAPLMTRNFDRSANSRVFAYLSGKTPKKLDLFYEIEPEATLDFVRSTVCCKRNAATKKCAAELVIKNGSTDKGNPLSAEREILGDRYSEYLVSLGGLKDPRKLTWILSGGIVDKESKVIAGVLDKKNLNVDVKETEVQLSYLSTKYTYVKSTDSNTESEKLKSVLNILDGRCK